MTLLNNSEEPFVRKLNFVRVLTTFVGIWLMYCLKPWRLLMEMEPEILLCLVRENMLRMSLSCWWRGRGKGVRGRNTMA